MTRFPIFSLLVPRAILSLCLVAPAIGADEWVIDSADEWAAASEESRDLDFAEGLATPTKGEARYRSVTKSFDEPRRASTLTFRPSPAWDDWTPVPNVGPEGTRNAPVFLPVADGDYWFFAEKTGGGRGYHGWRSSDMETWEPLGKVAWSQWVTTAEYADGKIFLYYDEPNDQDPHLMLGENLEGEISWTDHGEVLADPTHGSDAGAIRTEDGSFHLIYEDWSPINAKQHSWDSPLAGHADSENGIDGFEPAEHPAPIDERTEPTGKTGAFRHGFTSKEPLEYEIHEPEQDAYGDYSLIGVGDRFYLFCDYDPHGDAMRVGYWSSEAMGKPFQWGGDIGMGFHPDPTIGFAEGRFYLIVQRAQTDFVSPGPWVETVEARVGVDEDGDGGMDEWTDWAEVRETYAKKPGFARLVDTTPAALDLAGLPEGRGFRFEFRVEDATENESKPVLDRVEMAFE